MSKSQEQRKGFTIIEVALVLAITGLILIGILSGVSTPVARQRYNDSVQSIAEQFRTIYSQVNNPQGTSDEGGNNERAIYGKLVLIRPNDANNATQIDTYTVTGKAEKDLAARTSGALDDSFRALDPQTDTQSQSTYTTPWEAVIQSAHSDVDYVANPNTLYRGSFLIIHSPNGGAVHTYVSSQVNTNLNNNSYLDSFSRYTVDLCVNSPDLYAAGNTRRNIRIDEDGRNSSAVQLVDVDSSGAGGNQC